MPTRKDKEEEAEEFKVVDRRLFTSDGELRKDLPPEPAQPAPSPQQTQPTPSPRAASPVPAAKDSTARAAENLPEAAEKSGNASREGADPQQPGAVQFEHLIMSLVTSAMYQLGMAARPGEIAPPPDLPAARETIDLLALLQVKTKGNLTSEEEKLLTGSLQELRLVFVEITRQAGRIR
jgi:Domain of unknown function (DUF1844)